MSTDLKTLAQNIVGLTLLEAAELKKILKDEYGIEPAAGGAVMMAGPGGAGAAAAPVEEQTEFDVVLMDAGAQRST
jgi:large subunit ribosomal protein L7/L12